VTTADVSARRIAHMFRIFLSSDFFRENDFRLVDFVFSDFSKGSGMK
jgi:hypothetical protein